MTQKIGHRLSLERRAELAKQAFTLKQSGVSRFNIATDLDVSEPTARNLINYGRRLAAGAEIKTEWRS